MSTLGRKLMLAACLVLATCTAQCRSDRSGALLALVPDLAPEVAVHLVGDTPEQFAAFAHRVEHGVLVRAMFDLRTAPPSTPESEFVRVEASLAPYRKRVAESLASAHANRAAVSDLDFYDRHTVAERIEITKILREAEAFHARTWDSVEAHAAALDDLLQRAAVYPNAISLADLYGVYASVLPLLDRSEDVPRCLNLGIEAAVKHGDIHMACQLLGTLGCHYEASDPLAMRQAWDRALEYARQANSWQEARILSFYASYHRDRGQLAIARDLLIEAQDRCRALGATKVELRFLLNTMDLLAQLNCWEEVGRGLERAGKLAEQLFPSMGSDEAQLEGTRLQVLRARHAAASGQCDQARRLALDVAERTGTWSLGPHRTMRLQFYAAKALSKCESHVDARALFERCIRTGQELGLVEFLDDYSIELATTFAAMDSFETCERILAGRAFEPGSDHAVRRATLRLKIAMSRNDRVAAYLHLREALQGLDDLERGLGASAEAYIAVSANDELRRLAHEYLDPISIAAGYGFEMRWRTALTRRAGFEPVPSSGAAFVARLEAEAQRLTKKLEQRGAVHCFFDVREAATLRYVACAAGVTRQEIEVPSIELQAWVQQASSFTSTSTSENGSDWSDALSHLAKLLLPDSISTAQLLLTTANGCLARLQFEMLNVADSGYVPLIEGMDVATLRFWNHEPIARGDSCLVVVDPTFAPSLRRRHSDLAEPLPRSRAEADVARRLFAGSVLLTGPNATKQQILPLWKRARILYFTGHMLQDPELRYLTFIPLGQPPVGHEDDSYLEVTDVRKADLSRCKLVVLSSCASGAPYASGDIIAPSMAEVFLDAGARAAVSTAWPVRDEAAARLMTHFIRVYAQTGEADPIRPLCDAQRTLAAETRDPSIWANYSIHVTQLEPFTESLRQAKAGEVRSQ